MVGSVPQRTTRTRRTLLLGAAALVASSAGLLAVEVTPARAALAAVAMPDTLTTSHDRTRVVPAPGVLANDTNLVGGTTAIQMSQASHGTAKLAANGGYTYTPAAGFIGTDQFKYRDSGLLLTNETTVTITVKNSAPIAKNDSYVATTGVTLTVGAPGVLANDTDADGDSLQAKLVDGGGNGSISLSTSGRLVFKSGGSFTGTHTFTYRLTDGLAWSNVATGSIDVRPPAPNPTPTPTATPAPTPRPTPPVPLPSLPVPSLPVPTVPRPVPTVRLPSPTPTPRPTTGRPSASPSATPAASASRSATSVPTPSDRPRSVAPNGGGISNGPGSSPGNGSTPGGPPSAGAPPFDVDRGGESAFAGLGDLGVLRFAGVFDWAVPSLALSVPGLLLILAVLAQVLGGAIWLPFVRRSLGSFGVGRRRRRRGTVTPA